MFSDRLTAVNPELPLAKTAKIAKEKLCTLLYKASVRWQTAIFNVRYSSALFTACKPIRHGAVAPTRQRARIITLL
jgi:hypothetical protein